MLSPTPKPCPANGAIHWWERPLVLILLVLFAGVPLLWPALPPLTDLPGHMGRYRVELDGAASPYLRRFFDFEWALLGNLGVDLLVVPAARLFGLELGVKLLVLAIPPLTVAGFLLTAREAHGRVPPTALFALPFAYGYPLHFGFVNFALSAAGAFLLLALWLRLGRREHLRARAVLFVPLSLLLWVMHIFGWGLLGVLAFAAEWARFRTRGRSAFAAAWRGALACLPLAPPALATLLVRSGGAAGFTGDWFNMPVKLLYALKSLADRWGPFDLAAVTIVLILLVLAGRSKAFTASRALGAGAVLLGLIYLLLPRVLLGSAYADMRLAPFMLAVAVLALRPAADASPALLRALALGGLAFVLVRTAAGTASLFLYDRSYAAQLAALDHIERGARVVALVGRSCELSWAASRLDHLPAMAIVRREAFANDQWTLAGAQLLRVRAPDPRFAGDPSQLVVPAGCRHGEWRVIDDALRLVRRDAFDYLWLIDPPAYDARLTAGLTPVWSNGTSVLFRLGAQGALPPGQPARRRT